jgi:hypothetical protein
VPAESAPPTWSVISDKRTHTLRPRRHFSLSRRHWTASSSPGPLWPCLLPPSPLRPFPLAQTRIIIIIVVISPIHRRHNLFPPDLTHRSASNTAFTDPGPEHHHTLDKRAWITSQSYIRNLRGCRESNAALVFGQPPFSSRLRIDSSISAFRSVVLVSSLL